MDGYLERFGNIILPPIPKFLQQFLAESVGYEAFIYVTSFFSNTEQFSLTADVVGLTSISLFKHHATIDTVGGAMIVIKKQI